ncbi:MAG: hypothetical protein WCD18_04925 [Thermosynechococcaceae cyanobacterium]
MWRSVAQREFSLMFAGALVALATAGLVAAYSLMDGCMGYLDHTSATLPPTLTTAYAEDIWIPIMDDKTVNGLEMTTRQSPQI